MGYLYFETTVKIDVPLDFGEPMTPEQRETAVRQWLRKTMQNETVLDDLAAQIVEGCDTFQGAHYDR